MPCLIATAALGSSTSSAAGLPAQKCLRGLELHTLHAQKGMLAVKTTTVAVALSHAEEECCQADQAWQPCSGWHDSSHDSAHLFTGAPEKHAGFQAAVTGRTRGP